MDNFLRQDRHRVRFDWGRQGAAAVTVSADVAVVIDVLSFTTTLTVALDRGTTVLPYRWNDGGAADYARLWGAGAVIAALHTHGWPTGSPEAQVAAATWQGTSTDVTSALFASVSGRKLTEQGYAEDVKIAAEVDRGLSVPLLRNHRVVDGRCSA